MSRYPCDTKVYVGDLGNHARKNELEDSFSYYGPLRSVWIARNPPGFAFVEFESARDAEDAVRGLDGRIICGRRARVEVSSGKSGRGYRGSKSRRPYHQGNLSFIDCIVEYNFYLIIFDTIGSIQTKFLRRCAFRLELFSLPNALFFFSKDY